MIRQYDSSDNLPSSSMNSQNHEGSVQRLEVAGDLSPIFVRELHKGNSQCYFYEFQKSVDCIGNVAR